MTNNEYVNVQIQDRSGIWRTMARVINNPQRYLEEMKAQQQRYPDFRVRTVDDRGSVVDIL